MDRTDPQLKIRLDPESKAWLDAKSEEQRLSRTWLINNLIRQEMKREAQTQ